MPTKFNRVFVRPNLEVEFPTDPAEFTQYTNNTYVTTGQCLQHRVASYSEDNLTKTSTSVWANEENLNTALADSEYNTNREFLIQYCAAHGISTSTWVE
jgi:hypothetical protein